MLPAVLLGPTAFWWLWAVPFGVLLLLNFQAYQLIEGNLSEAQRHHASLLGIGNLAALLIGLGICLAARWRGETASEKFAHQWSWGLPAIVVPAAYLWWTLAWIDDVLPRSVTTWIYPTERHLFNQFAFAMLPLFLGILRLAGARAAGNGGKLIAINLAVGIGGPVLLYVVGLGLSTSGAHSDVAVVAMVTCAVLFGVIMFIGITRALLLGLRQIHLWGPTGERVAIVVFAAVLPLCGLLLNRAIPFPENFQAWEVYALVLLNTGILLLASARHVRQPRLSFYLLSATFPFSLYFFIVFLPYTPLSILAVLAMGVGFLVLTPILLFVLHLYLLHKSRSSLAISAERWRVNTLGVLMFLLLPAFFTVRGLADKAALNAALDYVYLPSITGENLIYPGSLTNLRRALNSHRDYKNGIYYPLLSDFYSWLVFDHLVLPDDKLDRLEKTFFGAAGSRLNNDPFQKGMNLWGSERSVRDRTRMPRRGSMPHTVSVSALTVNAGAATPERAITTLTLTLKNDGRQPAEFIQTLPLPAGVYVSGFRLHMAGHLVPGRIFEKKTALWVYTMIRDSERRDPGLLYYRTRDELELRVFPVDPETPSVVEIDFLTSRALADADLSSRSRDPAVVMADFARGLSPELVSAANEVAVTGVASGNFPAVESEPYLHLIVDRSLDNAYSGNLADTLRGLREKYPKARRARVTLANFNVADLVPQLTPLDQLASALDGNAWERMPRSGALALDLCLARAIRQHRDLDLDRKTGDARPPATPIFVILSAKASPRPLELPVTENWRDLLAGLSVDELGADGVFIRHLAGADSAPWFRLGNAMRPLATRQALRFPAPAEKTRALQFWSPKSAAWETVADASPTADASPWSDAVALQLQEQDHDRAPGTFASRLKGLVAASRESGILTPLTSYIVVENSAQWRMLEMSERQKLDQNSALEFRETPAPPAAWVMGGFLLWLLFRRWRERTTREEASVPA